MNTCTSDPSQTPPVPRAGEPAPGMADCIAVSAVPQAAWRALGDRAIEPSGYYLPEWEAAVSASARGRTGASALAAFDSREKTQLLGLMPVVPLWRAKRIALPALVSAHPYGVLGTPLLDRDRAVEAVRDLLDAARTGGARAILLRDLPLDGAAFAAIDEAMDAMGLRPRILRHSARACLDATRDADTTLREALGARRLKDLRRLRRRLADHGPVAFSVARMPTDVARELEAFLRLEASGWKGARGTALIQHAGDAAFIRSAAPALAAHGQCEIATLRAGEHPVAAAVLLRHLDRTFYFKLGIDERFARMSPGVQLTLDITRHLCADPAISLADSTAEDGNPMIEPIWRGRLRLGDVLLPLRRTDPVVPAIATALKLHDAAYQNARRIVRTVRRITGR